MSFKFDINKIRSDFPILKNKKINEHPLIYFDNAATSQKPLSVINAQNNFYKKYYSSVHRSIHSLSNKATSLIESVRVQVADFINASSFKEIIFIKGTTEGINLLAYIWGMYFFNKGDNIIISEMEHHSNIVPWQIISKKTGVEIRIIPINHEGQLNLSIIPSLINKKTRLLSITHISNVLGTINPIQEIINQIKKINSNIITIVDGAQSIMHEKIDVQKINCDFYIFSGHKIYGPNGIGILYGRKEILKNMPPWEGGGAMIKSLDLKGENLYTDFPWCFEAGTPNICGIIGLGAALSYVKNIGIKNIKIYENKISTYAINKLVSIPNIIIYGLKKNKSGIISFNIKNYHSYDIGNFLDQYGITIRTGHLCAIPIMNFYKVKSMCRISLSFYNTKKEKILSKMRKRKKKCRFANNIENFSLCNEINDRILE